MAFYLTGWPHLRLSHEGANQTKPRLCITVSNEVRIGRGVILEVSPHENTLTLAAGVRIEPYTQIKLIGGHISLAKILKPENFQFYASKTAACLNWASALHQLARPDSLP